MLKLLSNGGGERQGGRNEDREDRGERNGVREDRETEPEQQRQIGRDK